MGYYIHEVYFWKWRKRYNVRHKEAAFGAPVNTNHFEVPDVLQN
jgi:hypothetical protein